MDVTPLAVVAVPAGGAVSLAALLSAGLLAIATSLVLLGLLKGYEATLGSLLTALAEKVRGIRWVGGKVATALESIDEEVKDAIGSAVLSTEKASAKFFHGAAWVWEATLDATADFARATTDAITGLVGGEIPEQITQRTQPISDKLSKESAWARARDRALARQMGTGIDRLQRDLAAERLARARGIDLIDAKIGMRVEGIEASVGKALAGTRAWVGQRVGSLDARIGAVTSVVAAGALTAAAVRALDLRFPWYKCRNVRRFNGALCRGNPDLLMDLLSLAALATIAVNPKIIAKAGQEIAEGVTELIDFASGD